MMGNYVCLQCNKLHGNWTNGENNRFKGTRYLKCGYCGSVIKSDWSSMTRKDRLDAFSVLPEVE